MSSKLDASLDDILKTRRTTTRRGRGGRRSDVARPAPAGPVGGVSKSTRAPKQPKATGSGAPVQETTGKILVSGLVSRSTLSRLHETDCSSLKMLTRAHSRYVRPLQVFEPTSAPRFCEIANLPRASRLLPNISFGLFRCNLRKVTP